MRGIATTRIDIRTLALRGALAGAALLIGVLAGLNPTYAATAIVAGFIVASVLADLAVGICLLAIIAFLQVLPAAFGGNLTAAKLIGLLVALGWLMNVAVRPQDRHFVARHPALVVSILVLSLWTILSALWAEGLSAWFDATQSWLLNLALFPIMFTALRERRHVAWFYAAWLVGAILAAGYGLVVAPPSSAGGRFAGALGPNGLGNMMMVATILAASMGASRDLSFSRRVFSLLIAGFCMIVLFLTVSREAIVGLLVALTFMPLVAGSNRRAGAIASVVLVICVGAVYFAVFAPPSAFSRFTSANDTSGSGRTDIWTVGSRMVQAHPIQGVGAGNFAGSSVHYLLRPGTIQFSQFIVDQPKVAHNIYLQVLAELGIIGLAAFVGILGICLTCAAQAARRFAELNDNFGELLARGLLLALLGLLAAEFFSSELFYKQLWLLLATAPALLAIAEGNAARKRAHDRVPRQSAEAPEYLAGSAAA